MRKDAHRLSVPANERTLHCTHIWIHSLSVVLRAMICVTVYNKVIRT